MWILLKALPGFRSLTWKIEGRILKCNGIILLEIWYNLIGITNNSFDRKSQLRQGRNQIKKAEFQSILSDIALASRVLCYTFLQSPKVI